MSSSKAAQQKTEAAPEAAPILKSFDMDGVVDFIKSGKAKRVVLMCGAGISVAAGIPDFRTPGTGLYNNLERYHLPTPESVFDINFFEENPEPFYDLCKNLLPGQFSPTSAHYFVKLLEQKGILLRDFTQNIDGLERIAGVSPDKVIQCHGNFFTAHCRKCNREYNLEEIRSRLLEGKVVHCLNAGCDGCIKPDIVFYGENLPKEFFTFSKSDFKQADLLLILGTSLAVNPFASLTAYPGKEVPRILINNQKVAVYYEEEVEIDGKINKVLPPHSSCLLHYDHPSNTRDVYLGGDLQQTIMTLVEKLGWAADLQALISQGTTK